MLLLGLYETHTWSEWENAEFFQLSSRCYV